MRKIIILLLCLLCTAFTAEARKKPTNPPKPDVIEKLGNIALPAEFRYRLTLANKANSPYSVEHPEDFLSAKSIERRKKFGLVVDEHDLPITPSYLQQISETGARIFNYSKWNNTVQVSLNDTTDGTLARLRALPFVSSDLLVYVAPDSVRKPYPDAQSRAKFMSNELKQRNSHDSIYGYSQNQADQLNLPALHRLGYRGEGMTIAILDGGFMNVDTIAALRNTKILGTRNFARPGVSVYDEHQHGMMVLSCIAPNVKYSIVGTAPEASFYLLESEDTWFEYQGEEDNWCAALEYADSLGVDVVTSSLGYTSFEAPERKLEYHWLDSQHELNSRSASLCASRGILLCNSAGNEGDNQWKKIGFPADAEDILTVGAVNAKGDNTLFSSLGYAADGRIKPDCMAQGGKTTVLGINGDLTTANGTSFSCPVMAGAVTCLMQACPDATPLNIIEAIHRVGNNVNHPNEIYGYGIPDLFKAYELLKH